MQDIYYIYSNKHDIAVTVNNHPQYECYKYWLTFSCSVTVLFFFKGMLLAEQLFKHPGVFVQTLGCYKADDRSGADTNACYATLMTSL